MRTQKPKQYRKNGLAGCVAQRRFRETHTTLSLYHNEQAHLDASAGPFSTVCERHGTICAHQTLELARSFLHWPEWCEACMAEIEAKASKEDAKKPREYKITFELQYRTCGDETCHCAKGEAHGPYWYAYWHRADGMHSMYIGKRLPGQGKEEGPEPSDRYRCEGCGHVFTALEAKFHSRHQVICPNCGALMEVSA